MARGQNRLFLHKIVFLLGVLMLGAILLISNFAWSGSDASPEKDSKTIIEAKTGGNSPAEINVQTTSIDGKPTIDPLNSVQSREGVQPTEKIQNREPTQHRS
jgi:hypothetical protein